MDDAEKYLLRQAVASAIDHPSVYMGGPSASAVRKAISIVNHITRMYSISTADDELRADAERVRSWRTSPWDSPERI